MLKLQDDGYPNACTWPASFSWFYISCPIPEFCCRNLRFSRTSPCFLDGILVVLVEVPCLLASVQSIVFAEIFALFKMLFILPWCDPFVYPFVLVAKKHSSFQSPWILPIIPPFLLVKSHFITHPPSVFQPLLLRASWSLLSSNWIKSRLRGAKFLPKKHGGEQHPGVKNRSKNGI